jgi:hypothetical protein
MTHLFQLENQVRLLTPREVFHFSAFNFTKLIQTGIKKTDDA